MTEYYNPTLPATAVKHWCSISNDDDRYSGDIAYITLDSGIHIDVGCYRPDGCIKDFVYGLTVVLGSEIEDDAISGWDNPIEEHDITDVIELVKKIEELAADYSIGGRKHPVTHMKFTITQYCLNCKTEQLHNLFHSIAFCNVCRKQEIDKSVIRYCPKCIKNTKCIISKNSSRLSIMCTECE